MNASPPRSDTAANGKTFVRVFVALCGLTLISVIIASVEIFPSKTATWLAFIAVACLKAGLVVSYFMHLRWEKSWKYILTIPASLLGLALAVSLLPDVGMRTQHYSQERLERAAESPPANKSNE